MGVGIFLKFCPCDCGIIYINLVVMKSCPIPLISKLNYKKEKEKRNCVFPVCNTKTENFSFLCEIIFKGSNLLFFTHIYIYIYITSQGSR